MSECRLKPQRTDTVRQREIIGYNPGIIPDERNNITFS